MGMITAFLRWILNHSHGCTSYFKSPLPTFCYTVPATVTCHRLFPPTTTTPQLVPLTSSSPFAPSRRGTWAPSPSWSTPSATCSQLLALTYIIYCLLPFNITERYRKSLVSALLTASTATSQINGAYLLLYTTKLPILWCTLLVVLVKSPHSLFRWMFVSLWFIHYVKFLHSGYQQPLNIPVIITIIIIIILFSNYNYHYCTHT